MSNCSRIAAAGFYDDPVLSWVFRDDGRRLDQLKLKDGPSLTQMWREPRSR